MALVGEGLGVARWLWSYYACLWRACLWRASSLCTRWELPLLCLSHAMDIGLITQDFQPLKLLQENVSHVLNTVARYVSTRKCSSTPLPISQFLDKCNGWPCISVFVRDSWKALSIRILLLLRCILYYPDYYKQKGKMCCSLGVYLSQHPFLS